MHIGAMCYVHAQLNPGCDGLQSTDIDTDSDVFPKLHTSKIQTRYMKGVPFVNRRYTKGVPFS